MHSIKKDKRYTQTQEGTGNPSRQWVARFCGEWISCHATKPEALQACQHAYDRRMTTFTWVSGKWHLWIASTDGRFLLSDEDTKCLRDFADIDEVVNWLFLNGDKDAARELNKAKAAI